jgi:hypothetical protein
MLVFPYLYQALYQTESSMTDDDPKKKLAEPPTFTISSGVTGLSNSLVFPDSVFVPGNLAACAEAAAPSRVRFPSPHARE